MATRRRLGVGLAGQVEALEARWLPSVAGTLDAGFGGGSGYVLNNFGFDGAGANAVAVQPDGGIVVAGVAGNEATTTKTYGLALTRLNPDGSADPSFGYFDGSTLNLGDAPASAVALGPGGIIAVAGANVPPTFDPDPSPGGGLQVAEFDSAGKSIPTFGADNGGGAFDFTFGPGDATQQTLGALAVEPDGSLLVGGGYLDPTTGLSEFAVAKVSPSGAFDASFGTEGVALVTVPTNGAASANVVGIALDAAGRIVLVGTAQTTGTQDGTRTVLEGDSYVARLDADGRLDASFGFSGVNQVRPGPPSPGGPASYDAFGLGLLADGSVEFGGLDSGYLASTRLTADGLLDTTYGDGGTAVVGTFRSGPLVAPAGGFLVQPDGKAVVAAGVSSASDFDPSVPSKQAVGRFNPDGSPDLGFGPPATPGLAVFAVGGAPAAVNGLALQGGGNLILAGSAGVFPGFTTAFDYSVIAVSGSGARALLQAPGDVFGTGTTPVSVYLADAGGFAFRPPSGPDLTLPFGYALPGQSIPALGDYDGVGHAELGAYLPSYGVYAYRPSGGGPDVTTPFGLPGAGRSIPTPADFSGDGSDDMAVYLPGYATYGIRPSTGGPDLLEPIGIAGAGQSLPAPADYFGTGRADVAVYVASLGAYAIRPPDGGPDVIVPFGVPGVGKTIPVPGDYDGSGHVELAVYLPATGQFIFRPYAAGVGDITIDVAEPGQGLIPAPGDYQGIGYFQFALYDPATATLTYYQGLAGTPVAIPFGTPGAGLSLPSTAAPGAIELELAMLAPASATGGVSALATAARPSDAAATLGAVRAESVAVPTPPKVASAAKVGASTPRKVALPVAQAAPPRLSEGRP